MTSDSRNERYLKQEIKMLEEDLKFQCKRNKEFGDELLYFQKQKANLRYELKLRQYKDKIRSIVFNTKINDKEALKVLRKELEVTK